MIENPVPNYPKFCSPKVYYLGCTEVDLEALKTYLKDTEQFEFWEDIVEAQNSGLSSGEILCSFYAKACYASLTTKLNKNITRTRSIEDNIKSILDTGHFSVIEHCSVNFMVTNCSRIYTHEQVRHRVGVAYSQTSGRYVRADQLKVVIDPILAPAYDLVEECRDYLEKWYKRMEDRLEINNVKDFGTKKKLTSAMRRMYPNGQSNEIGMTLNLRTLRHTIQMRTSGAAEWEVRIIYNQIYQIMKSKYRLMFADATEQMVDGQLEIKFGSLR